jgi:hypothetical protein
VNELALLKENRDRGKRKKVSTPQKDVTIYLTSGVNFINIVCTAFSYKSFGRSFFVLEVKIKLFTGARKLAQLRS